VTAVTIERVEIIALRIPYERADDGARTQIL
jgi:hypothetical protein